MEIFISIWIIVTLLTCFYIFLYYMKYKISLLEEKTLSSFKIKNNLMPGIYELSKNHIQKHDAVFSNIMKMRKIDFSSNLYTDDFYKIIYQQQVIHKEINFIFMLCTKHRKLIQNEKFLYIREQIVNKSYEIWNYIEVYRRLCKIFNKLLHIKNFTLIGIFIPLKYKVEI